jgi:uncharacterized membrane protein
MAADTFFVLANQYSDEADARADFDAVRKLYTDTHLIDTYDAAVLTRKPNGKVSIVKRVEEPTRQAAGVGLITGLAVGAAVALFPAAAIPAGAVAASAGAAGLAGAGAGAIAGHVTAGMKRSDLKELGELLDRGASGLIVVAASDMTPKVEAAITRAKARTKAQLQADVKAIKQELEATHA